jgi:hypothetical protein
LNECGEVRVTKQVLVLYFIIKYSDKLLCGVVHMHMSYLFWGHLWQFNRRAIHHGFRNRYFIVKDSKTIIFIPLSPKQVYEDQMKLKDSTTITLIPLSPKQVYEDQIKLKGKVRLVREKIQVRNIVREDN